VIKQHRPDFVKHASEQTFPFKKLPEGGRFGMVMELRNIAHTSNVRFVTEVIP
jgi:hypothetical protein